jgi:hypothetical protein
MKQTLLMNISHEIPRTPLDFIPELPNLTHLILDFVVMKNSFNQIFCKHQLKSLSLLSCKFDLKFSFKLDFSKLESLLISNCSGKIGMKGLYNSLKGNETLRLILQGKLEGGEEY